MVSFAPFAVMRGWWRVENFRKVNSPSNLFLSKWKELCHQELLLQCFFKVEKMEVYIFHKKSHYRFGFIWYFNLNKSGFILVLIKISQASLLLIDGWWYILCNRELWKTPSIALMNKTRERKREKEKLYCKISQP